MGTKSEKRTKKGVIIRESIEGIEALRPPSSKVQKSLVGVDEIKPTPPQAPPQASSESESSASSAQEGEGG